MQALRTSLNAAVVVTFGEESNIAGRLYDRSFKVETVPALSRRANVSQRSMALCIVMKLHRPVQTSWSAHILASPLFGVTKLSWDSKNLETRKSWKRSVASPSRENLEIISDSRDSSNASKAESRFEADISKRNLESDEILSTNGCWPSSDQNKDLSHVSDNLVTKSVVEEDPDFGDRRQSGYKSSNTKNETQADSDNVGVGEREQGENELKSDNGDNDQDIPLSRKRMGRPKRKKKKAHCAGIATYDSLTNTIRLKGSTTETVHSKDIEQHRQRSFRSSKCQPTEQGIQGTGAKSESNAGPLEEVTGGVCDFDYGNRSTGKSLGVEEAARLSRLLGLEELYNSEQPNPKLVTQDDAHSEQSGYGGLVQPTVESNKAVPSQEIAADDREVALKSRPVKKFPGAKTKVFEQNSESGKWETMLQDLAVQAAPINEVDPRKDITKNSQTSKRLNLKVFEPVVDVVSEPAVEQVDAIIDQVTAQVNEQVQQVRSNTFVATESVTSTPSQVAESISSTATQLTESVASTVAKFSSSLNQILEDEADSEDEFEESTGSDCPEFRGLSGLRNYSVLQEDQGTLAKLRDFYFFMMKKPLPEFAMGMVAAPLVLSLIFTLLYLPEFQGLAYDETARNFLNAATGMDGTIGLELSLMTIFQVFMFSLSLSTGLQPDLAPLSPYALVIANLNALIAQLILAFLSAAVFARLSQPAEPVRCSSVALICAHNKRSCQTGEAFNKVLSTRCVLAGPQPCELVNVKVDLTYRFNAVSNEGSFSRSSYPLKLVRSQLALLDHGMLVRHIIDESSPLYSRTPEMLRQDDAIFVLSVGGVERSSMQPVFHVQFYSVCDEQVIWNAEFEDMILINKKNQRVVDHSKLSSWKSL